MDKNFLAPGEIVQAAIDTGKAKTEKSVSQLVILGILAGAFIALAAQGSNMAAFNLLGSPETFGLGRMIAGAVFAIGLMLVVTTGTELFTGNTLICVAVYEKKATFAGMLRNWIIVYLSNFVGAVMIAWMMSVTGLWNSGGGALGAVTVNIAINKVNMAFAAAFVAGILCNWLVCLAVWIAWGANTMAGKMFVIFFPIFLFVTSGFEHSIANMYYVPAGIFAKGAFGAHQTAEALASLNWGSFITGNLIPVTLGNIVGGVLFVGTAYWFTQYRKSSK